jgi:FecR protein
LQAGDRILTGPSDRALVTFLDGSTVTVEPTTDIVVQQADVGDAGSTINIRINLGTVWARVVRLADPGSSFSLSSSTATAVVHEGLPGAQTQPDGTFMCWTFDGDMTVSGANQPSLALQSHETATLKPGTPGAAARPVSVSVSALRITTSDGVLPLLAMPDGTRVAGFVAPGVEVNQVFGSFTDASEDSHTIEVPGGDSRPFTLMLEGQRDDAFSVEIAGLANGNEVYTQTLSGTIAAGQRLVSTITQQVEPASSQSDSRTAIVLGGTADEPQPLTDAPPGRIILSPTELASIASN